MRSGNSDIYNSGYSFAKEINEKKRKRLILLTVLFGLMIIVFYFISFFSGLNLFSKKKEVVKQTDTNQLNLQKSNQANQAQADKYKNAGIPYRDPQNRYAIKFATPFPSDQVVVIIYQKNQYEQIKKDADDIIAKAKSSVEINDISYLENFK